MVILTGVPPKGSGLTDYLHEKTAAIKIQSSAFDCWTKTFSSAVSDSDSEWLSIVAQAFLIPN